jgi:hypothetical protein
MQEGMCKERRVGRGCLPTFFVATVARKYSLTKSAFKHAIYSACFSSRFLAHPVACMGQWKAVVIPVAKIVIVFQLRYGKSWKHNGHSLC